MQTVILAAERRIQLGAARAVAGLPAVPKDPKPSQPNAEHQLQNAKLPHTNQEEPPTIPPARPYNDQFYDIEAGDGDLELSGIQLYGSKEALEDLSEDEGHSKRAKKSHPHPRRNK
jgi:hypothetical protein